MNNRLQKKCFIAATGFHVSLLAILLFGSAFFSGKDQPDDRPPINFIPTIAIDEALSGGGSPRAGATAPPPQPTPPQPQPQIQQPQPQPREPVQPPDPPKAPPREPAPVELKPKPKGPTIDLTPKTRPKDKTTAKSPPTNRTDSQNDTKTQQTQLANALRSATQSIRQGLSGSTEVELPAGPGGGGQSYANFLDVVKKVYTDAWIVPDGAADDDSTVAASVTIAKNGDVVTSRITRPSGNRDIDRSVQMTLDRVRFVIALPESAKERQRTVTIKFNAKLKRGLG